ncbi:MAG: LytR C-terminal domain-containing protein [Patescibacteria group bacterium]|nr:LytR C-terminal domain-containing protein [Patescibacteria group bacterium]
MRPFKRSHQSLSWKRLVVGFVGFTMMLILGNGLVRGLKASQWNGQRQFGWVIQSEDLEVMVIIPNQKKLISLIIPKNTIVKVGFGFGEYRLNKVYELGKLENQAGKVLMRTVQELLGVGIDGWEAEGKSNLSWWDKIRLKWWEKVVVTQEEKTVLIDNPAWQSEYLTDGSLIYRVNQVWLDELVHQKIFDQEVSREGLTVAVLNASGVDGVANNISRLISNFGIEVRLVGNLTEQIQTEIVINRKAIEDTKTLKKVMDSLGIKVIKIGDILEYRSDLVVIIGKDYTYL